MEEDAKKFSVRHGFASGRESELIRDSAPEALRCGLLQVLADRMEFSANWIRQVVCGVLRIRPDGNNWSDVPVWREAEDLVHSCEWFKVYDIVEGAYAAMDYSRKREFERLINTVFDEEGIGWRLEKGVLHVRGAEASETLIRQASKRVNEGGLRAAASELREAISDLSRRPDPDLSGAMQHGMAALESVSRHVCGDTKSTLGQIIK